MRIKIDSHDPEADERLENMVLKAQTWRQQMKTAMDNNSSRQKKQVQAKIMIQFLDLNLYSKK